ncbi:TolC family protein [Brevundimonas nasdae]|uniref:TolC family protein n=1 Tax=Brevundimonas nasdae TaxID=172043 RepID=A0ABX8TIH7_9CAUL|nr:TolC family protein [Brevundimonas nasdae]QYC11063.1 TolC family protein [Brevundimonas nasdae]QYC13850.1 TolC family protein [Brevundimonas nasdae]
MMVSAWIGLPFALLVAGVAAAQTASPQQTPLTYAEASARLRTSSSLSRAAGYGVDAASEQAAAAAGLRRPTVSLDAQAIRYRKTFDISLTGALDKAQSELGAAIPGLISDLPGIPGDILQTVGQRLQAALPEIFAALPTDVRLEVEDTAFRPTLTALQPIYSGGAIPALQRAAAANVDMAQARRREAMDLEGVNLARAYFGQVLAAEAVRISTDTRDGFDLHLRNAQRMEREGVLSHAQTLQVQVARDASQRQLDRAQLEYDNSVQSLGRVLNLDDGVTPTTPLFVNRTSVGPMDVFIAQASQSNARIAQAQATRDLAEAGVDLAESRFRPTVYAFGTYNLNPDNALPTEPDWAVGIGARYTLMSSIDRRRMAGAARSQAQAAGELERQARDDARLLVTRAYNQAELARRQFLSMDSSLTAATENLRVQEIGFREGESPVSAVVDARNLLGAARLQRAVAAYEYDLSLAALLAAASSPQTLNDYLQRDDRISAP